MADTDLPPVLIRHPGEIFNIWRMDQIYKPGRDRGHVPNVNDLVFEKATGFYNVDAVTTDGISTLTPYQFPRENEQATLQDILLGAGPGNAAESYRIYVNSAVTPHTLAFDSRLHIHTETASYVRVFRGIETGERGIVISAYYDQSGNFIGDKIPLALAATDRFTNLTIKSPLVAACSQTIPDGELVSAVIYDDVGIVLSINRLLIVNTDFIRTNDASIKYIVDVSVETPFLSPTDPTNIVYPINMPVESLNLIGVVTYSDGSQSRLPVDGTKFSMYGLQNYVATIQGQEIPLVLSYRLGPDEYNYISTPSPSKTISKRYTATTAQFEGAYSVKLFAYPVWINQASGYRLEYRLYNLERQDYYTVTSLVQLTSDSRSFDPTLYGTTQKIQVAVNLRAVDPRFKDYRHTQTLEITLRARGDEQSETNWTVGFSPGQNPPYGQDLQAKAHVINAGNWELDLSSGAQTLTEWLERVFYRTQPLVDPTEVRAPQPNFFTLRVGNHEVEVPINQWGSIMTVHEMPAEGDLVYLAFFRRGAADDLQLGTSGLIVHRS